MNRLRINLFAMATIVIGASALGTPAAEASMRNGCDSLLTAKLAFVRECSASGGTSYQCSSSCSSDGYSLNCTCYG